MTLMQMTSPQSTPHVASNFLARLGLLFLTTLFWAILTAPSAQAAGVVGTGSPASCDSNDLQAAITGGGLVTFNCGSNPHTITAATYVIEEDTTVRGDNLITLDGEDLRQLFIVDDGASLDLVDLILLDGEAAQGGCISVNISGVLHTTGVTFRGCRDVSTNIGGGAVYNLGTFTATNTLFESNEAVEEGGAIFNRGTFTAEFVTFEANQAGDDSGAIENDSNGIVVINDSAFIGNSATQAGGAVGNTLSFPSTVGSFTIRRTLFVDNSAETFGGAINNVTGGMIVENSTFVRNSASQGGAFFASGNTDSTITFSTFDDNRADTGAGIYRPLTGVVRLGYSILTGGRNQADSADSIQCDGPSLTSLGYNLIADSSCVNGSDSSDLRDTPPLLGALADNGGYSQTALPDANSPALDKVPSGDCLARDQRLARRSGTCDIGAVERGAFFESAFLPRVRK